MNLPIKNERHILDFERPVDQNLAISLGEMVVAFGRLEDTFKVAIKRLETPTRTLEEVVQHFTDKKGSLGYLVNYCESYVVLKDCCHCGSDLNKRRQDYIHATFALENGEYVRFRKLTGFIDIRKDVEGINALTNEVYFLISKIDEITGALLTNIPGGPVSVSGASG